MKKFKQFLVYAVFFVLGGVLGFLIMTTAEVYFESFESVWLKLLWLAVVLGGTVLLAYLQIALHEAGHLVGGLMTGYRFSSYRIGSLMLLREGDRLVWRRLSVAGTGGQCLMVPPPLRDGKIPYIIYNLGGAIANLLAALLMGLLWLATDDHARLAPLFAIGSMLGLLFALTNGIPLRVGMVDNDGRNALMLGRDPDALRAFWVQMQVNAEIASGKRLHEMPDEWFETAGLNLQNTMVAALAVFSCNRLVDAHRFEEADCRMRALIGETNGVIALHRRLLAADVMYIAWLHGDLDRATSYNTPEQKKFMRAMKNFPSVVRTNYAEALLARGDTEAAEKFAVQFERIAKSYPYPADLAGERELMVLAKEAADARN